MTFNVSEFTAQIGQRGLAKNNLFVFNITLPTAGNLANEIPAQQLSFLCRSCDIPGFGVQTTVVKERGLGPGSSRPVDLNYNPLQSVFMVDTGFTIKRFFHRWMQEIVNYNIQQGVSSASPSGTRAYEFGYKDEYAGTIEVITFGDNSNEHFYTYRFGNAYPINIGNVSVAWENQAEIMTLPVTFTYDEFTPAGSVAGSVTGDGNLGNGLIGELASLGGRVGQTLGGINLPRPIQDIVNVSQSVRSLVGVFT